MKAKATTSIPSGTTFTTSSATYVDLLDASGGSTIAVTITKSAGTKVHIRACVMAATTSANGTVTIGVNDGTTDYDVSRMGLTTSFYRHQKGDAVISGLAAGTFTFKLRVKSSAGTFNYPAGACASIVATEIAP